MGPPATSARWARLDDFVEAFEVAQVENGHAELGDFLPGPDHPLYQEVLVELIRVDLEYGWKKGKPRSLEEYRLRFPEIGADEKALECLCFEEYRLRLQAEEAAPAAEPAKPDTVPEIDIRAAMEEESPPPGPEPGTLCPLCGTRLIDPKGFGLCPNCPYCRTLAEASHLELGPLAPPSLASYEYRDLVDALPGWLKGILAGVIGVGLLSFIFGRVIPVSPHGRAVWALAQLLGGILLLATGKVSALLMLTDDVADLGLTDLFISERLWARAYARLPETRWPFWLASWGATLAVSAVIFVGGLSYWW